MPKFKKLAVAILVSMSFFFSDVVFAEHLEIAKENKASSTTSSRVMKIVAEKYSKVVQIYETIPSFIDNTKLDIQNEEASPGVMGVMIIVEQRAVLFSSNRKTESVTSEKSKRKPGHTHEENERHEIEKIGPEEEES